MNKKIKKIIATGLFSTLALGAIGCGSANTRLAKNIDRGMADFVSSINNLDYVDTKTTQNGYGKIIETATTINEDDTTSLFNNQINSSNVENTITKPSERNDNFKLYILSESPFISLSSNDNNSTIEINAVFSTEKIETKSDDISEQINKLILKRSILMIYVNELYNGNVDISEENKTAINAYINVIKENASFLNGNRGMVRNQLNLANNLLTERKNNNLVNYYMIKSGEALETRSSKIESTISAIDSIIAIIENNLKPNSAYYQTKLSTAYEKIINDIKTPQNGNENQQIASNIANSLNFDFIKTTNNTKLTSNQNVQTKTNNNEDLTNNNNQKSNIQTSRKTNQTNLKQNITNNQTENINSIRDLKYDSTNEPVETKQTAKKNNAVKIANGTNSEKLNDNTRKINGYDDITMKADRTRDEKTSQQRIISTHPMRHEAQNIIHVPYEITNQD